MHRCVPLIAVGLAGLGAPALALDKKLDPDPTFLAQARTAATAKVEAHYDLVSDKVPFWARFIVCTGQLIAARDEGRALPIPRDQLDPLIADYRRRAIEVQAYRQKADAKAPALDVDAEIAKVRSDAMSFLPADTTRLGVERMKVLHGERLAFCQLTRDWYEVQNGLRAPTPTAEQQRIAKINEEAMRQTAANAPKPPAAPAPMPPAIKPSVVQPVARAAAPPAAPAVPAAKVIVPPAGSPVGGEDARDARVGADIDHAEARADFAGRALWSALAECVVRMELIQTRTGNSTRPQAESYAGRAAYVLWGNRGDVGGNNLLAMAGPVNQERARLAARVAASWDEHRQRTGQLPDGRWGQVCWGLDKYALAYADRILQAKRAQAQREHAEAMKKVQQQQATSSSGGSSGGYMSSYSGSSGSSAEADRSRMEHQRVMEQYKRENAQIKRDIQAIDRKYR